MVVDAYSTFGDALEIIRKISSRKNGAKSCFIRQAIVHEAERMVNDEGVKTFDEVLNKMYGANSWRKKRAKSSR